MRTWRITARNKAGVVIGELDGDAAWVIEHCDVLLADPLVFAISLSVEDEPAAEPAAA